MRFHLRKLTLLSFTSALLSCGSTGFAQLDSLANEVANHPHASELELYASQPLVQPDNQDVNSISPSLIDAFETSEALQLDDFSTASQPGGLIGRVWNDHLNLYSRQSILLVGFGLGAGAIVANTKLDGDIQRHLQSSLHRANSDEWLEALHANKELGDGRYTLPVYASAWAIGSLLPESEFSQGSRVWGERTLRGFMIGAPPVLLLQRVTGSSRPGETVNESEWEPLRDNNGVSGHAFMGALPFITAAKMSDSIGWKTTFYAASALAPLSRTADGAHYPSQVALGWWMAFVAATAVHATDNPSSHWRMLPLSSANGSGMGLEYRF